KLARSIEWPNIIKPEEPPPYIQAAKANRIRRSSRVEETRRGKEAPREDSP
ncbi:hypothetical protein K1T71_015107, partial [Dendrolimus kikuchii]